MLSTLAGRARAAAVAFARPQPPAQPPRPYPRDFTDDDIALCEFVRPYTMTSNEALAALRNALRYVVQRNVPGAIVECGVWRGGSMMAAAMTLHELGVQDRDIVLMDTFDGMPPATPDDVSHAGESAAELMASSERSEPIHAFAPYDGVVQAMSLVPYPAERVHFVKGMIEQTVPGEAPDEIALLRLDTDWYESTRHELVHLFPRLSRHGVLIVDDYGYWRGSRKAVDEYFAETGETILLHRVDRNVRLAIKL